MSEAPRLRQIILNLSNHQLTQADIAGLNRANGCTCDPWITLPSRAHRREAGRRGRVAPVRISHDANCPRLQGP